MTKIGRNIKQTPKNSGKKKGGKIGGSQVTCAGDQSMPYQLVLQIRGKVKVYRRGPKAEKEGGKKRRRTGSYLNPLSADADPTKNGNAIQQKGLLHSPMHYTGGPSAGKKGKDRESNSKSWMGRP